MHSSDRDELNMPQVQSHDIARNDDDLNVGNKGVPENARYGDDSETDEGRGSSETKKKRKLRRRKWRGCENRSGPSRAGRDSADDGASTPATVSIDSEPTQDHIDESESSSDEGDEEDEGLVVPLASTMTSIPSQITRSLSRDGTHPGSRSP